LRFDSSFAAKISPQTSILKHQKFWEGGDFDVA